MQTTLAFSVTATEVPCSSSPPSVAAASWERRDAAAYDDQVRRSVIKKEVSEEHVLAELVDRLGPDPRATPVAGLVLRKPYEELGLPAWVRIVESGPLTDIHSLADLQLPTELEFFDCMGSNGLNFASPMFAVAGFSIELLHLDVMHVVDLGVAQYLVGAVFRTLIENDVSGCGSPHVAVKRAEGLKHLRRRMNAYYKSQPRARWGNVGDRQAVGANAWLT